MDNKILFGLMCCFFNGVGVPCFMQGDSGKGVSRIVLSVVTIGVIGVINTVYGIILGIEILNMPDEEYASKKGTFYRGIPN